MAGRFGKLVTLVIGACVAIPAAASAASVTPTTVTGNPGCSDIDSSWGEIKVDNVPQNKTYSDGTRTVTVSNVQDQKTFDWSSDFPVVAVLVKASTETYVYQYDPPVTGDTGMGSPGKWAISHVDWCYDTSSTPPPACTGDACEPGPNPQTCEQAHTGEADTDGDAHVDACDNCPATMNAGQEDNDHNSVGDACEAQTSSGGGSTDTSAPAAAQQQPTASEQPGSQAVLGERVAGRTVRGTARLISASGCSARTFSARVRGTGIARVVFTLDGKRVVSVVAPNKKGLFTYRVNPAKLGVGVHRIVAKVYFKTSTGTKARTLRASFQRCGDRLIAPRFTG